MTVRVNGRDREVAEGSSVLDLLRESKLSPEKVAVELNRRLIRTERYGEKLKAGDEVEVVTFVGGG